MKIFGLILLFFVLLYVGFEWSKSYERRVIFIQQSIQAFQMIEAEMYYTQGHLHVIFNELTSQSIQPIHHFFSSVLDKLVHRSDDFAELWNEALDDTSHLLHGTKEDIDIIRQLGKHIGFYPYDQQTKYLQWTIQQLEVQLQQAFEERNKYSYVIKMMSVLIGLLFIVLFI